MKRDQGPPGIEQYYCPLLHDKLSGFLRHKTIIEYPVFDVYTENMTNQISVIDESITDLFEGTTDREISHDPKRQKLKESSSLPIDDEAKSQVSVSEIQSILSAAIHEDMERIV